MSEKKCSKAGWSSRKVIMGGGTLLLGIAVSSLAMFILKDADGNPAVTFNDWSSFIWKLIVGVLVPLFPSMTAEKIAELKNDSE